VKIGIRRTGVPTKRIKSRQRSRIHGDGFDRFGGEAFSVSLASGKAIFANGNTWVPITV